MGCLAVYIVGSFVLLYGLGRLFGTDVEIVAAIVLTFLSFLGAFLRHLP